MLFLLLGRLPVLQELSTHLLDLFAVQCDDVRCHDDYPFAVLVLRAERIARQLQLAELDKRLEKHAHLLHVVQLVVCGKQLTQVSERADLLQRLQIVSRYVQDAQLCLS